MHYYIGAAGCAFGVELIDYIVEGAEEDSDLIHKIGKRTDS